MMIKIGQMRLNQLTSEKFYGFAEKLTRKWWFYLLLFLCVLLPPVRKGGFSSFGELVEVVSYVAEFLIEKKLILVPYMPVFHIGFLLVLVVPFIYNNQFGGWFSLIVGVHFAYVTYLQAGAVTEKYGLVFYPNGTILFSLISLSWFWESKVRKNNFTHISGYRNIFLFGGIVSLLSFWNPDRVGNYSPLLLLTSTSPIAFCMITPIYLSLLAIHLPKINLPLFRIMSFVGIMVGIIMVILGVFMEDRITGRYWSVLHSPMLISSVTYFLLGLNPKLIRK